MEQANERDGMTRDGGEPRHRGRSLWARLYGFLSGYPLATVLLLLLLLLTWLGTLEQVDHGLHATLQKYFDRRAFIVIPRINGRIVPLPLPGVFWVSALLFVNLLLGGIVRARKGWRTTGVLIAHGGILFLLCGAMVTHLTEQRGSMAVSEGEISDAAEDYFEHVIEITEIVGGKAAQVHVVAGSQLADLRPDDSRVVRLPKLPFDLRVSGWLANARPVAVGERAPQAGEAVVDGYWLLAQASQASAETNTPGCVAKLLERDGHEGTGFLLSAAAFYPQTVEVGGRTFTVDLRKRLWPMPFAVRLDDFRAVFHPGTMRPAKFESDITRIEDGHEAKVHIRMNQPMRYRGLTFFQASWGPQGAAPGTPLFSVFEVVRNPADKWPEYSLYVVAFGMAVHFLSKLARFSSTSADHPSSRG